MPHTLHVVSHTHWDREWYLTYQQFRMRLVDLIDRLLALLDRDPDFHYFNLDAQTIVLEDYLAVKPHNRERLEHYIREGRITLGPWYQLNDEFLTSGEATVRSLLVGTRIAQQFGACMKLGYLPDQFGNLSQMPQIFRGFGIDNAILGRGYQLVEDRKMEFLWESPDGSQVTASLMAFWYNNAQRFPADPQAALKYTEAIRDRMAPRSAVSHLLLMNGVDHLEAQYDLSPILTAISAQLPDDTRIIHSTLPDYINSVKDEIAAQNLLLDKVVGELREDRGGSCLAGTLSTRMYLKQANHHAQVTLEKYAEPFSSFALLSGTEYPYDFLHYAWKLLMQNHPHDSICGCSVDQVHREMMPRFQQVEQIGEEIIARSLRTIAERVQIPVHNVYPIGAVGLVMFNSLNWERTDPVIAKLQFPLGEPTRGNPPRDDSRQVQGFMLTDETGKEIPFAVTNVEVKMKAVLSPVELPLDQWVQEYTIEFIAHDVPACGYKAYAIDPRRAMPEYDSMEPPSTSYLEEPYFTLNDVGDVGDEYLYRKPLRDRSYIKELGYGDVFEANAVRHSYGDTSDWLLPVSATLDVQARKQQLTNCPIQWQYTRWKDVPRKEFRIAINNQARDHRIRLTLWSYNVENIAPYAISEGQFDVITRSLDKSAMLEEASNFYPQQFWTALTGQHFTEKKQYTFALANKGLTEVETSDGKEGHIEVTLLRCVGYLSRRGDGPQFETPEAQCLGEHTFELAVFEHEGDWKQAKVWKQAHQFNVPLRAVQTTVSANDQRDLPPSQSFVTVEPDSLVVTALKRAEDDPNTLIVRFFNITDDPVTNARVAVPGATAAKIVNLNEEPEKELTLDAEDSIQLEMVRPKQIVTLSFTLGQVGGSND